MSYKKLVDVEVVDAVRYQGKIISPPDHIKSCPVDIAADWIARGKVRLVTAAPVVAKKVQADTASKDSGDAVK